MGPAQTHWYFLKVTKETRYRVTMIRIIHIGRGKKINETLSHELVSGVWTRNMNGYLGIRSEVWP